MGSRNRADGESGLANNRDHGRTFLNSPRADLHTPVLLQETVELLKVRPGGRYIDGTVGAGGHAAAILDASQPGGSLLGLDADPQALEIARERLASYGSSVILANANFRDLLEVCRSHHFIPVDGILLDLGMSSVQLEDTQRGFSFRFDAPLDMRFNPDQPTTAADILNHSSEAEIARILHEYGEERHSRRIARRIVAGRPVTSAHQLVKIVESVASRGSGRIHPATRTFQALRIAVNQELSSLQEALRQSLEVLRSGGRLVVISYHSLEDRTVKQFMAHESRSCICPPDAPVCTCGHEATLKVVTRKAVVPGEEEIQSNPRSRSARLRSAERL